MFLSKFKIRQNYSGYKIFSLIIFLFISIHSNAQNEKFTISGRDITVKQVFEQIEAQSKYTVAYSKAQIDVSRKITIKVQKVNLKEVLEQTLKDTGFTYKINGLHIIIVPIPANTSQGNTFRQTIKGVVKDAASGSSIPYATVILSNTNPQIGTTSDSLGRFRFNQIPIGRYDIQVSYLGYEPTAMKEILLTSAKEVSCDIALVESSQKLDEVVVRARVNKNVLSIQWL